MCHHYIHPVYHHHIHNNIHHKQIYYHFSPLFLPDNKLSTTTISTSNTLTPLPPNIPSPHSPLPPPLIINHNIKHQHQIDHQHILRNPTPAHLLQTSNYYRYIHHRIIEMTHTSPSLTPPPRTIPYQ